MYIADMLSRAYLKEQQCKETPPYQILQLQHEAAVFCAIEDINLAEYLRVSEATQHQIDTDVTLQTLLTTFLSGWQSSPTMHPHIWGYREEITAQNGVLIKALR